MTPTIKRLSESCTEIVRPADGKSDFRYLYISDIHLDNPHCDRHLLRQHLDQALESKSLVFCFGDVVCAMQNTKDPRAAKEDDPYQSSKYVNHLINDVVAFFRPYKDILAVMSDGNHETAFTKHYGVDLLELICQLLQAEGSPVQHMPYQGWIKYRHTQENKNAGSCGRSVLCNYDHGRGGGGPVTRNVIETNRRLARVEGADILVYGHVHEKWQLKSMRERLTAAGNMEFATQLHLQCSTYKQEYAPGNGFHMQRGGPPKPLGGWWVRHRLKASSGARTWHVSAEETF